MDSARQLDALLSEQLDVAILRVTPQMLPSGRPGGSAGCCAWSRCCSWADPTTAARVGLAARAARRGVRRRRGVGPVQRARASTSLPSSGRPGSRCAGSATLARSRHCLAAVSARVTPPSPSSSRATPSGTPRPASPSTTPRSCSRSTPGGSPGARTTLRLDAPAFVRRAGGLGAAAAGCAQRRGRAPIWLPQAIPESSSTRPAERCARWPRVTRGPRAHSLRAAGRGLQDTWSEAPPHDRRARGRPLPTPGLTLFGQPRTSSQLTAPSRRPE